MNEIGYFQWTQRKIVPQSALGPNQLSGIGGASIGLIVVAGIFVLIAVFLLREPIKDVAIGYVHEHFAAEQAKKEADAYRALERDVASILDMTDEQLKILSNNLNQIASEFETNLGVPLNLAHMDSTPQIDDAILTSQSFKRAFKEFLNARIPPASIEDKLHALNIVKGHLKNGTLTDVDKSMLQTVLDWIISKQEEIQTQQSKLQQIITLFQNESYPVNPIYTKGD